MVARSNRCRRAADALIEHLKDPARVQAPELEDFGDFNELEIKAIYTIAHKTREQRFEGFDEREYIKAMDETAPVLSRPRYKDDLFDLWRTLAQPEMIRGVWEPWNGRPGTRGRDPGYFAKALLLLTAARGESPYFWNNYNYLRKGEFGRVPLVFDWIENKAAALGGRRPQPLGDKDYARAVQQIGLIVDPFRNRGALTTDACVQTNIDLLKQLAVFHSPLGLRLGIDSMFFKAWVKQIGRQDPIEERRIRRRAVHATPRRIDGRRGGLDRFVRGYSLVVLTDLTTNLAVTWGLFPAGEGYNDAKALRFLLNDLFEKWPGCPTELIVADRAWDNKEAIRDCAVRFGIHLIVGRDEPSWNREPTQLDERDHGTIGKFDGRGVAYCRQHGIPMRRTSSSFGNRRKRRQRRLSPGEPFAESEFRLRHTCPIGGGLCDKQGASLQMEEDWAALSYYPHTTAGGREDLHAMRLAMYARRNSSESLFSALKRGHNLGLNDAVRTHTDNERTVETLFSLALVFRTAFAVGHERTDRSLMAADPPPALLDALSSPLAAAA